MLSASSNNNHSLFSFSQSGRVGSNEDISASFDFLPSVSFDELQSSLETASTEFQLTQFPSPTDQGSILESREMAGNKKKQEEAEEYSVTHGGSSSRTGFQGGSALTRAMLRRPSTSKRQTSVSSAVSSSSLTADGPSGPPSAPAAMRNRRQQSHYPPVSSANIHIRQPRKSGGAPVLDTEIRAHSRRQSLVSNTDRVAGTSGDDPTVTRAKLSSGTAAAKAWRATEAGPTAGHAQPPDQLNFPSPRSPGLQAAKPPAADRRRPLTSGLGARTISPTDTAREQKRRSMMPQSQSLQQLSSVLPLPPPSRGESRSPSMIPRKASATPSSSRTTPDMSITRKSYGSGLSLTSSTSTSHRTSTGSLQRGLSITQPSTWLPAPKSPALHGNEDEEDVPPVPAIPKAYESPKTSPADPPADTKRRPPVTFDASSINSSSTGSASVAVSLEAQRPQRRPSARKSMHIPFRDPEKTTSTTQTWKNLESLRLPPHHFNPLPPTTLAKIAALSKRDSAERITSPPPQAIVKTPTTPMTASKSTFFSRHRSEDPLDAPNFRSSSSAHNAFRASPPTRFGVSPPTGPIAIPSSKEEESMQPPSISPFLSLSLPKPEFEPRLELVKRSRTDANGLTGVVAPLEITGNASKSKGHREPNILGTSKSTNGKQISSPEEPPTPSSMSSIRRKLSITWKRSASKSGHALPQDSENHEALPRKPLPTPNNLAEAATTTSPSPSAKKYLESRRRKSAASLLTGEKQSTEALKGPSAEPASDRSTVARGQSMMHKILKSKSSTSTIRSPDGWTANMDRSDGADEEMKRMGLRRKETEAAARTLEALHKRATPKERVGASEAIRIAMLNIFERGEIHDYGDVYFCGTQNARKVVGDLESSSPNFGYDDERGDYTIVPGDHLAYRYEIIDVLGKGSFGQVVRCIDHKLGTLVAIKIIRNKKRFHQQALVEVNILQKLRDWDPKNRHSMVNFMQSFYFRSHLCISTELLDMNLYELIKARSFRGLPLLVIRRFTKQMLSALNLLKQHRVIHCDLKPENILLRHPLLSEIKVIDFGSSCFENEKVYTYIQSRFYRSPEVILGMTYGMPIDMWSLGCILAELLTGVPIFPGENEQEQLACIMEVFGPPEKHLIEKSTRKKLFFDSMGKPRLTVSSKGRRRRPSSKSLQQALKCDDEAFLDFVARCLRWDPDRRMKPEEATRHEFITGHKTPSPNPPPPRLPAREGSPVKRSNTIAVPRPLPEPPGGSSKSSTAGVRPREISGMKSPHKAASGAARRTSAGVAVTASKRASISGMSGLPRPGVRAVNPKLDLASAGAAAAMNRRG